MTNSEHKGPKNRKIVLAVQGSCGHVNYAAGILDAFRAHDAKPKKNGEETLNIHAGSGCVEMLTPLSLYLAAPDSKESMREPVTCDSYNCLPPLAQLSMVPPSVRPDAWKHFMSGLLNSQQRWVEASMKLIAQASSSPPLQSSPNAIQAPRADTLDTQARMTTATAELMMYGFGLPGNMAFNPLLIAAKHADLAERFESHDGPTIFTNATRADNFNETYLYFGKDPTPEEKIALCGSTNRRQLLRLTPEYFFASGARPPYIAPMSVNVGGEVQHWMEGAMRCNPPLTPLIDIGATHIILIRFFAKDNRAETHNHAELNERFMDAMFSIPLQKEIESIKLNNHIASSFRDMPKTATIPEKLRQRRCVTILDPADRDNYAYSSAYSKFLNVELNALSHYETGSQQLREQMFERGFEIGTTLIKDLHHNLKNGVPDKYDQYSGYRLT